MISVKDVIYVLDKAGTVVDHGGSNLLFKFVFCHLYSAISRLRCNKTLVSGGKTGGPGKKQFLIRTSNFLTWPCRDSVKVYFRHRGTCCAIYSL